MQLTAERLPTVCLCLCVLAGCARSAVEALTDRSDGGGTGGPSEPLDSGANGDAAGDPQDAGNTGGSNAGSSNGGKDSGVPPTKIDSGMPPTTPDSGPPVQCTGPAITCGQATTVGEIDASDSAAVITQQGKGNAWFAVDLKDGDKNAMGNTKIGVGIKLTAAAGSTYTVTLMGDTSPGGGGRCVAADVTDTDPLDKTAIWGSFGPTTASLRVLAVHVEHVSGPCDASWTLTIAGNPCPELSLGFGEDSLGSCP